MTNYQKWNTSSIKNLILVCALSAVVFAVSTFAWFVGMRSVGVSTFDVEIKSTDSLQLSFDGRIWGTEVSISRATLENVSYTDHTNSWGDPGLIPMSSVGDMDIQASRMILYEKASFTKTPGGYRLIASRVDNYNAGETEKKGYVVFDLFIKNFSGTQYLSALEPKTEEAIFLTTDSEVKVAADGVENTGIENSVRVAFAQIGRVIGTTTDPAKITAITCVPTEIDDPDPEHEGQKIWTTGIANGVTGICRTAQIWEPNDKDHVVDAISYYDTSCLARTGVDVTLPASYSGPCGEVANGIAYPTYAVKKAIASSDNVDIYDGLKYNGYETSETNGLLDPYDYFTDTMKELRGVERPLFMTLQPNSITKVRVYIFIEGQDVDNYDFAAIGKRIAVNFGFTKERLIEDDFGYEGPPVDPMEDKTPPLIELIGANPMTITVGTPFVDPGATAEDNIDGDLSADIVVTGEVDAEKVGTYYLKYNVSDENGNDAVEVTRTVIVEEEE